MQKNDQLVVGGKIDDPVNHGHARRRRYYPRPFSSERQLRTESLGLAQAGGDPRSGIASIPLPPAAEAAANSWLQYPDDRSRGEASPRLFGPGIGARACGPDLRRGSRHAISLRSRVYPGSAGYRRLKERPPRLRPGHGCSLLRHRSRRRRSPVPEGPAIPDPSRAAAEGGASPRLAPGHRHASLGHRARHAPLSREGRRTSFTPGTPVTGGSISPAFAPGMGEAPGGPGIGILPGVGPGKAWRAESSPGHRLPEETSPRPSLRERAGRHLRAGHRRSALRHRHRHALPGRAGWRLRIPIPGRQRRASPSPPCFGGFSLGARSAGIPGIAAGGSGCGHRHAIMRFRRRFRAARLGNRCGAMGGVLRMRHPANRPSAWPPAPGMISGTAPDPCGIRPGHSGRQKK